MTHFTEEMSKLKESLLAMASHAESALARAMRSLIDRDDALAQQVIEDDNILDQFEIEVDDIAIHLLAKAPLATELRLITVAMKISQNLERVGDEAVSIARRSLDLSREPQLKPYIDIPMMGKMARMMVKQSIDAFVKEDAMLARKVLTDDDFVDDLMEQLFRELLSYMIEDTRTISRAIRLSFIAKYLERMADHATNIAELVVYLVEGKIIRHTTPPVSSRNYSAES